MAAACTSACRAGILAQSKFDAGDEGWTQVNVGADYRYLDDIETRTDCPEAAIGVLSFCDPDAGQWMFNAPAKFLGNKSDALDGYIEFSSWDRDLDDGSTLDPDPEPSVIVANGNTAIVILNQGPDVTKWTTYRYEFNESAQWLWVDDETPMDALPFATRAQIQHVLANVTALRIRGEALVGDDQGWLDDVSMVATTPAESPKLSIHRLGEQIEISWPADAVNFRLESSETIPGAAIWDAVSTAGATTYLFNAGTTSKYFRLHRVN